MSKIQTKHSGYNGTAILIEKYTTIKRLIGRPFNDKQRKLKKEKKIKIVSSSRE